MYASRFDGRAEVGRKEKVSENGVKAERGRETLEKPYPRKKSRKEGRTKRCGGKEKNTRDAEI